MPNAYITEFQNLAKDAHGTSLPIPSYPSYTKQVVTFTTSVQSAAFHEKTKFIRVVCDAVGFFNISSNPTATGNDGYMAQDVTEYMAVNGGDKIAFYDGSS